MCRRIPKAAKHAAGWRSQREELTENTQFLSWHTLRGKWHTFCSVYLQKQRKPCSLSLSPLPSRAAKVTMRRPLVYTRDALKCEEQHAYTIQDEAKRASNIDSATMNRPAICPRGYRYIRSRSTFTVEGHDGGLGGGGWGVHDRGCGWKGREDIREKNASKKKHSRIIKHVRMLCAKSAKATTC